MLDEHGIPDSLVIPCPSGQYVAAPDYAVVSPDVVLCMLISDHKGPHLFKVEWNDEVNTPSD